MNVDISECTWLNDHDVCTAAHLAEVAGLSNNELDDLIESGIILPVAGQAEPQSFHLHYVVTANIARRLRDDFELDQHGLTLALALMRRIDQLQNELNAVRARLDQPVSHRD